MPNLLFSCFVRDYELAKRALRPYPYTYTRDIVAYVFAFLSIRRPINFKLLASRERPYVRACEDQYKGGYGEVYYFPDVVLIENLNIVDESPNAYTKPHS